MINLKINKKFVKVKKGMTLLEAAESVGVYIPTLCSHSVLLPYGGCRLCIVEIEGQEGFPTACTTPVEEGMVVHIDTKPIQELRRRILELILSEHPYTCLVCDRKERCQDYQGTIRKAGVTTGCEFCPKNGECELQEVAEHIGIKEVNFPVDYKAVPVEKDDPFFERDYNLCILCGRCVRICQELRGIGAIAFTYRGSKALVGTAFGRPLLESGCEFCGACIDVCPSGALSEKINKWEGPAERSVETICPYCGVGCKILLNVKENRVIGAIPSPEGKINQGQACVRGRFCIPEIVHSPNRLKTPLIRKNGNLVEVNWDEALDTIAENLSRYKAKQFAFIASSQCTNEDSYIFQKFTRIVMGSNNITIVSDGTDIEKVSMGESNLMGAFNMGCLPRYLPGYQLVSDEKARKELEALWQCTLPALGGLDYAGILKAISKGQIKALYLTDDIDSKDLSKLDFLVVQSVFPLKANEFAHVVLPAASFAEVEGAITNIKGDIQLLHKAIGPLYNCRCDWWILSEIAKRLKVEGFDFKDSKKISSEIGRLKAKGIKRSKLKITPLDIKPSDGFYNYRGGSLIDEVKGMKEVVEHWRATCIRL